MVKKQVSGFCEKTIFTRCSVKHRVFIALVVFCNLRVTIADSISTFYSFPIGNTHLSRTPLSFEPQIVELQPSPNADQVTTTSMPVRKLSDAEGKSRTEVKC